MLLILYLLQDGEPTQYVSCLVLPHHYLDESSPFALLQNEQLIFLMQSSNTHEQRSKPLNDNSMKSALISRDA